MPHSARLNTSPTVRARESASSHPTPHTHRRQRGLDVVARTRWATTTGHHHHDGRHSPGTRPTLTSRHHLPHVTPTDTGRSPRHLPHVTACHVHHHPPRPETPNTAGTEDPQIHPPPPQGGTPCANLILQSRTFVNFLTLSRPSSASLASFLLRKGCKLRKTCTKSPILSKRSEKISRFVDFPQVRETFL
jgi:hypothetical protein